MVGDKEKAKRPLAAKIEEVFGLDLRSLAVFRIGLALMVIWDLIIRVKGLNAHYTDYGILPRSALIDEFLNPWYLSIHVISGEPFVQGLLFLLAFFIALAMLVGYRTRLATIATWALVISLQHRNPALIFAADDVLRAILFWAMFLPLGASYSVDSALNTSTQPLPKRVVSGATFALMVQLCFIYMWSAAYKTQSEIWWPQGDAVYYSLSFDQYVSGFGLFLLSFPPLLLKAITFSALWFEWIGPLMIFIPFRNSFFRCVAIVSFILLHVGFELSFELGVLSFLSMATWLALLPSPVWDGLAKRLNTDKRRGLRIYYDADCGFCKKVVHLIRTVLILPRTPLRMAQEDASICADMEAQNSWVVVDWQENRHFKFEAIAYVVSLSPLFGFLARVLRWRPVMAVGTRFYETIASNRRTAGMLTKPLKFRPIEVRPSRLLNAIALALLMFTFIWNLRSFAAQTFTRRPVEKDDWISATHKFLNRRTFQRIDPVSRLTRLDQSWSIFAPSPPLDDGWHVIEGKLKNGSEIDVLLGGGAVNWEKPTPQQLKAMYGNQQWRVYFINLNRAIGKKLYPYYGKYLCRTWNATHDGGKQLESFEMYFMDERTVPPGEPQEVEKVKRLEQSCSD